MFSDLTKNFNVVFVGGGGTLFKGGTQTLRDYNPAGGLAIHTRFDDLDLRDRYANHELQFFFLDSYPL